MRFLLISILAISLFSCKSYEVKSGFVPRKAVEQNIQNLYFADPAKDYVYKTQIDAYGKNYGGIMIMKKVSDSTHRVVLATDFGNKLLDFELSADAHHVNYIVDELDRKIIVRTLVEDLRILLSINQTAEEEFRTESAQVYKILSGKNRLYYFKNNSTQLLAKIVKASRTKEKVTFTFDSKNTTFVENITIQHTNIRLRIKLNQITD